jgi:hypothetical protein
MYGLGASIACAPRCGRVAYIAAAMLAAGATAGCIPTVGPAQLADARGTPVTFESVEGPPATVVGTFMRDLGEEASARQLAVVPRGATALYRIRGYLAQTSDREGAITWAWDVYDAEEHRAFRFTGAEPIGRRAGSAWPTDDAVLRKIARASVDQLVAFIARGGDLPEARTAATPTAASSAFAFTPSGE